MERPIFSKRRHHLAQDAGAARRAGHQVVGQQHGKGLVAHQALGAQHRVAQAQRSGLAHVAAYHVGRLHRAHQRQQFVLVRGGQLIFQFVGGVEVVFDRAFAAPGDKDHVAHARGVGFLDRVLDQRLVHHRQHLLGSGLGGRQKPGAEAGNRENGGMDFLNGAHGCRAYRAARPLSLCCASRRRCR
jgi:hypothetical protein